MTTPDSVRTLVPRLAMDLPAILGPLTQGRRDPTARLTPHGFWRVTLTPDGPASVRYRVAPDGGVEVAAWGPGAACEVTRAEMVLGQSDDDSGFDWDAHPLIARARRGPGQTWHPPATGRTWEALAPAILEQRVTGLEARNAWITLVRRHGEPAPGPASDLGMFVIPPAQVWARIPSWEYHRAGVDPARMRTLITAGQRAAALERLGAQPPAAARAALASLPGIGQWTAAEVAVRAWGDLDAVSFGDYHLAKFVGYNLSGRTDTTDAQLAELLTPWSGQRARAVRMIELTGSSPPRHGPRATIADHRNR